MNNYKLMFLNLIIVKYMNRIIKVYRKARIVKKLIQTWITKNQNNNNRNINKTFLKLMPGDKKFLKLKLWMKDLVMEYRRLIKQTLIINNMAIKIIQLLFKNHKYIINFQRKATFRNWLRYCWLWMFVI